MATNLIKEDFVFRGSFGIKERFAQVFQAIFADPKIVKNALYRYSKVEADTKIKIYPSYPQRAIFYPSIVMSIGPFDGSIRNIGNDQEELGEQIVDGKVVSTLYGGNFVLPVICGIYGKSSKDRDVLRDYLFTILRVLARGRFGSSGIAFSHFEFSGDSTEINDAGVTIYREDALVHVNTDYSLLDPVGDDELISKVVIDVLGRESENSPPEELHREPPF